MPTDPHADRTPQGRSASNAAEQILADRRCFLLDDAAWTAFEDALERPPVVKPRLRALLGDDADVFSEE